MTVLPKTIPNNVHLPDHLANMCLEPMQKPVNPHRQRLLAASSRAAKVDIDGKAAPKSKGKAKAKNGEEKKEAKPKAKAKAKAKAKSQCKKVEMKTSAKDVYTNAKKAFMEAFLDWLFKQVNRTCSSQIWFSRLLCFHVSGDVRLLSQFSPILGRRAETRRRRNKGFFFLCKFTKPHRKLVSHKMATPQVERVRRQEGGAEVDPRSWGKTPSVHLGL